MPSNVNSYGQGGNNYGEQPKYGAQNQDNYGGQRKKPRVFTPVTMRMVQEASPRPDDVCEIDGEAIQDVSESESLTLVDYHRRPSCEQTRGTDAHSL